MTDNLTKNIESQKSKGDTGSVDSSVKTPLVDALRLHFAMDLAAPNTKDQTVVWSPL